VNLQDYDIPKDAFRLKDFLDEVLQTVVSIYESNNMPLPKRRYWTMAAPTMDCEQVVVSFINLYLGTPGDEASRPLPCDSPTTVVVSISIARKSAVGAKPTEEAIQEVADTAAVDTWLLMENLSLFDTWGGYSRGLGVIATMIGEKSQGGMQETRLQLALALP
jgi:hypothetical protein